MQIIERYLQNMDFAQGEKAVYQRIIHTTGDPEIVSLIRMSDGFAAKTRRALEAGASIWTDVEMIRTGISKPNTARLGNEIHCAIQDEDVRSQAKAMQITRAATAVRLRADRIDGTVYAVGNAPTALFELLRLVVEEGLKPAAIVGVPVGFVGAAESKDCLLRSCRALDARGVPWITVKGTRGGSTIAVAILNALLKGG